MFEIFAVVGSILLSFLVIFKSGESKGKRKVIDNLKKETKEFKIKHNESINKADKKHSNTKSSSMFSSILREQKTNKDRK